ncbi:hypothetical protein ACLOJK_040837 [Asimina triloba]
MKKASREKEKKATLDACRDEVFGTPYGGGDGDDDDDDGDDDIDIARRESIHTAAEDEQRRQMYSRSQSVHEAGGSSGSKSGRDSPYFQVFVDAAAETSSGVKAPSSYEIDGKYAEIVYDEIWEQTSQQGRQEPIIEIEEGSTSSSATHTDHGNGSESGDDDSGSGPQPWSGVGGTSETVVPSTYPYHYASQSQAPPSTNRDRGKNSIIEGEEEEEEEEEEGDPPIMDSFEGRSPWPSCNPNIYTEPPLYPHIPHYPQVPLPQAPQPGIDTYDYLFGYPPQSGYGYGQYMSNTSNNDDNAEEPPRHSFWW